jgi:hypothetical protein
MTLRRPTILYNILIEFGGTHEASQAGENVFKYR